MIKLDPEINHTAIRAIKTMGRIPASKIMRVLMYTHVALVIRGNRLQRGYITGIQEKHLTIKNSNDIETDIPYEYIYAIDLSSFHPYISKTEEGLVVYGLGNESMVAANIDSIVPMYSPVELADSYFNVNSEDGSVLAWSPPSFARTAEPYNIAVLHMQNMIFTHSERPSIEDIAAQLGEE
jgi:hypothetical protein